MSGVGLVLVALGGALGSCARVAITWVSVDLGAPPWIGTLAANLLGAALCGALAGCWMERHGTGWRWREDRWKRELLAVAGFCGGLTTLSTLADDAAVLWRSGHEAQAAVDLCLHGFLGCFCCATGFLLARRWVGAGYCPP